MKKIDYYEICKQKLKYLNYSKNTIKCYLFYINEFLDKNFNIYPTKLNSGDFQSYLDNYEFSSISQQNQIISAIKFFYRYGLDKKYGKVSFKRPRKEKHLPSVIDSKYLINHIEKIKNLKHKSILSIAYSVGLRISEVLNLKIEDIDSKRMVIYINNSKGNKDRIVPLSENILKLLRKYWLKHKPNKYLFNGQFKDQYSGTSCNKIVKKYLGDEYHFHTLRHSCFTTLLESGVDIRIIQKIAGHSSIKTTEVYTHVSKKLLNSINLPI